MLRLHSFDLDLPVEIDDEYWENDNAALVFQQPPTKSALIASFNCFIKLSQIMAFALGTLVRSYLFYHDIKPLNLFGLVCCRQIKIEDWRSPRSQVERRSRNASEHCDDRVGGLGTGAS
jgi:hypothetical protein